MSALVCSCGTEEGRIATSPLSQISGKRTRSSPRGSADAEGRESGVAQA